MKPVHPPRQRRIPHPPRPTVLDHGPMPYVADIHAATLNNDMFRTVFWTGNHLQLTLMSIRPGKDIGLENHPHLDQFLRVEEGQALVMMGERRDQLTFRQPALKGSAVFVPAGTWHNLVNIGNEPLKLYSIYAPPNHPRGAVHPTKEIAERMEGH